MSKWDNIIFCSLAFLGIAFMGTLVGLTIFETATPAVLMGLGIGAFCIFASMIATAFIMLIIMAIRDRIK